jgi:chromosome partitioning protein
LPEIEAVAADPEELEVPRGEGRAVLDVPAGLNRKRLDALVRASDALVVPLLPSLFDEAATERFLRSVSDMKPVRKGKRPIAVVPNRVRAASVAARRLDSFLEGLTFPAVTRLSDSSLCVAAADTGRTIFDLPPGRTRKLREEWAPLLAFLDELADG